MSDELEQMFDDNLETVEEAETEQEAPAEVEAEKESEKVEPEKTEESKQEEETAPTAEEEPDNKVDKAFLTKALDERDKRQALKRENDELKARLAKHDTPEAKKDIFEDPDGVLDDRDAVIDNKLQNNKLEMSVMMMKDQHEDYEDVVNVVLSDLSDKDLSEILAGPHPARAMYKMGQDAKERQEIGDPKAFKENLEVELRAKIEAEMKAKAEGKTVPTKPTGSLANVPASGGDSEDTGDFDAEAFMGSDAMSRTKRR